MIYNSENVLFYCTLLPFSIPIAGAEFEFYLHHFHFFLKLQIIMGRTFTELIFVGIWQVELWVYTLKDLLSSNRLRDDKTNQFTSYTTK